MLMSASRGERGDLGEDAGAVRHRDAQLGEVGRAGRRRPGGCAAPRSPLLQLAEDRRAVLRGDRRLERRRRRAATSRPATMASRLSAQTSGQMAGCPAATRVMSRKPAGGQPQQRGVALGAGAAAFISVAGDEVRHVATPSRRAGRGRPAMSASTSAPRLTHDRPSGGREATRGRWRPSGVSTQAAPTKRSASAPRSPNCSEPAIGWPPTKRGSSIAVDDGALDPATSVTTRVGTRPRRAGRAAHRRRPCEAGTATKATSASRVVADRVDHPAGRAPRRDRPRRRRVPGHLPAPPRAARARSSRR